MRLAQYTVSHLKEGGEEGGKGRRGKKGGRVGEPLLRSQPTFSKPQIHRCEV